MWLTSNTRTSSSTTPLMTQEQMMNLILCWQDTMDARKVMVELIHGGVINIFSVWGL